MAPVPEAFLCGKLIKRFVKLYVTAARQQFGLTL
jgi:hypothetical protein